MTVTLKNKLQDNLDAKGANIATCIVSLSNQGYIVNSLKKIKLKLNWILRQQVDYIESFPKHIENILIHNINEL